MIPLGICTDGIELEFEKTLLARARLCVSPLLYLEIGLETGRTFKGAHQILTNSGVKFHLIGIEPNPQYLPHFKEISHATIMTCTREQAEKNFPYRIDFAFIDGCHAIPCVKGDFLMVEEHCNNGCVVVFHDFGEASVGEMQPHCNEGANVRKAVQELGLFNNARPHWLRLDDFKGDQAKNGADCGVFMHTT